jgi:hypothetical protein
MAPARAAALESEGSTATPRSDEMAARRADQSVVLPVSQIRRALAWSFCVAGLNGQPYAAAMQHADLASGILVAAAFLAVGRRSVPGGLRDWLAMLVFAAAGAIGGVFSEVCADGVSATCRRQEYHFQLPASQYLHVAAGIVEFAAITVALFLALRRTRASRARTAGSYRWLWRGALVCYPLLGLAYLVNRMGGVMEAVFFAGFTIMVITQMAERTRTPADDRQP